MKRRNFVKTIAIGNAVAPLAIQPFSASFLEELSKPRVLDYEVDWHLWQDMKWVGPEFWGNRMQDWFLENGKVVCKISGQNRSLHSLTIQSHPDNRYFETSVEFSFLNKEIDTDGCVVGIRVGAKGPFKDYRSAAVFGKGLDVGVSPNGDIHIGSEVKRASLEQSMEKGRLSVEINKFGRFAKVSVKVEDLNENNTDTFTLELEAQEVDGNFALFANCNKENQSNRDLVSFSKWRISGDKMVYNPQHSFGPIMFSQYTLHHNTLKCTAQLAPVEQIDQIKTKFETYEKGNWKSMQNSSVEPYSRTAHFRFENWDSTRDIPYRICLEIPMKDGLKEYTYEGTIAAEPLDKEEVKTAVFSCNFHHGFPDQDVYDNVSRLKPDLCLFLGDQFYEGTGGFGVDYSGPFDQTSLDYLRKWYMFGWSYRELFRHKPSAFIPDDHDVWHGNVWGEGGKQADLSGNLGYEAQDSGGYKMPAEFVNMVQMTQTQHLPDPIDPSPVKQGIEVYFTEWNYGGLSFAILEDRKFKSAPRNVLPPEAEVRNGWIQSDTFDIKAYKDLDAVLLGERQLAFLKNWAQKWDAETDMKVVLSQTNFSTVATIPKGEKIDAIIPRLPIPQKGEYITGDVPTADMDSNGWPQKGRDKALKEIRKAFAFHIAGDQHLPSFIQYGIDEFGDSGYAFAGPALNNIWPRRFWPPVENPDEHRFDNPAYVGNHFDGFGNRMTVLAVGNPYETHLEPEIIHNRSTGYGLVTFNKKTGDITTECWNRFVDPIIDRSTQQAGWPITINQKDNYGRKAVAYLPTLKFSNAKRPLVSVFNDQEEHLYTTRIFTSTFQPKVFQEGTYRLVVKDGTGKVLHDKKGMSSQENNENILEF